MNKAMIIGNLGNDPDTKYLPSGSAVTNISVATTERWRDKDSGEKHERTEWHRVAFFGRLAEVAGEYLRKGSKVYVEGEIQTRKWQDKDGNDRYTTEIKGRQMEMLDSKSDSQASGGRSRPSGQGVVGYPQGNRQEAPQTPQGDIGFDDDIPF